MVFRLGIYRYLTQKINLLDGVTYLKSINPNNSPLLANVRHNSTHSFGVYVFNYKNEGNG